MLYRWNKRHRLTLKKLPCNVGRQLKRHMKLFNLWFLGLQENKTLSRVTQEAKEISVYCKEAELSQNPKDMKSSAVEHQGEMEDLEATGYWLYFSLGPWALLCSFLLVSSIFLSLQNSFHFYSSTCKRLPLLSIYKTFSPPTVSNLMSHIKFSR